MNCFISINSKNKAKRDIDHLMQQMGYKDMAIPGIGHGHVETFVRKCLSMVSLLLRLKRGDVLVIQYPFKKFYTLQCRIAHLKGAKVITLIHDLGSFRRRKLTVEQEMHRLAHTDYIIAHNPKMKEWIMEQAARTPHSNAAHCLGTPLVLPQREGKNYFEGRIVCLGIFDYLSPVPVGAGLETPHSNAAHCLGTPFVARPSNAKSGQHKGIVYAGGLGERKNAFLYLAGRAVSHPKNQRFSGTPKVEPLSIDVYGSGNLDTHRFAPNIHYHGYISSDDFIRQSPGDWGLVWDGDSTEACSGIWGEYLKYNNPHKASFYIRAGLPVIVWKQAAMAPFVETEGVGIAVDSLGELPQRIAQVTDEEYARICERVHEMAQRLQQGYYFRRSIEQALQEISGIP